MEDLNELISELEVDKSNLLFLSKQYDKLFSKWIKIEIIEPSIDNGDWEECADLQLLQKLQTVLSKASTVKSRSEHEYEVKKIKPKLEMAMEKTTKNTSCRPELVQNREKSKKTRPRSDSVTRSKSKPTSTDPTLKDVPHLTSSAGSRVSSGCKTYLPAHINAPFKTHNSTTKTRNFVLENARSSSRVSSAKGQTHFDSSGKSNTRQGQITLKRAPVPVVSESASQCVLNKEPVAVHPGLRNLITEVDAEISRMEQKSENPEPEAVDRGDKVITLYKTIEEAGDNWQIPSLVRREYAAHSRAVRRLDRVFLQHLHNTDQSKTGRTVFLESIAQGHNDWQLRCHNLRLVVNKLEKAYSFLEPARHGPVIPIILQWCHEEMLQLNQSYPSIRAALRAERTPSSGDTVRQMFRQVASKKPSWTEVTSALSIAGASYLDWSEPQTALEKARVSVAGTRSPHWQLGSVVYCSQQLQLLGVRRLLLRQKMQLCWGYRLDHWSAQLHEAVLYKHRAASFYRQLHGLLLDQYPVLLQDVP